MTLNGEKVKEKLGECELSPTTINTYIYAYKRLGSPQDLSTINIHKFKEICTDMKLNTKRSTLIAIMKLFDVFKICYDIDAFFHYKTQLEKDYCQLLEDKKKSGQGINSRFSYKDVLDKLDEYRKAYNTKQNKTTLWKYYYAKLSSYGLRPQCWNCIYSDIEIDGNYVDLNKKQLLLKKYKTDKTYGRLTITLDDETIELMNLMRDISNKTIFVSPNPSFKKNTNTNDLTKKIKRLMGFTCNDIRHLLVEYNSKNQSSVERRESSKKLGHSLYTQIKNYRI